MRHRLLLIATAVLGALTSACAGQSPVGPTAASAAPVEDHLSLCANEINRYRASVGKPPLARSQALESFAADAAEHDTISRVAHKFFADTNGAGVSRAQTEILWWRNVPVDQVVEKGLAQMWKVGPGGSHYDILTGPYTQVGCGVYVSGNEVTVAQDFR